MFFILTGSSYLFYRISEDVSHRSTRKIYNQCSRSWRYNKQTQLLVEVWLNCSIRNSQTLGIRLLLYYFDAQFNHLLEDGKFWIIYAWGRASKRVITRISRWIENIWQTWLSQVDHSIFPLSLWLPMLSLDYE